jgi:hypothetical protein
MRRVSRVTGVLVIARAVSILKHEPAVSAIRPAGSPGASPAGPPAPGLALPLEHEHVITQQDERVRTGAGDVTVVVHVAGLAKRRRSARRRAGKAPGLTVMTRGSVALRWLHRHEPVTASIRARW